MSEGASLEEWLNAAVSSAEELATVALGFDGSSVSGRRDAIPSNLTSALIALVSERASVQLGVASTDQGCQQLARALLGMEPDEDDLPDEDVADAVGEVINIVAGQVKRIIGGEDSTMTLGLPLIVHGRFESSENVDTAIVDLMVGHIPISLMVLMSTGRA